MTTIDSLWKFDITLPVLADFFGHPCNWNGENFTIICGLYKGLQLMEVKKEYVEECFKLGKLDEMFHQKYKGQKSDYYKTFCEKDIKIGKTEIDEENEDDDENDHIINEAYQKYGKEWVEKQREVQSSNIDKIMTLAHQNKQPGQKFYDRVYDKYGNMTANYFLNGKEVPVLKPVDVQHWVRKLS